MLTGTVKRWGPIIPPLLDVIIMIFHFLGLNCYTPPSWKGLLTVSAVTIDVTTGCWWGRSNRSEVKYFLLVLEPQKEGKSGRERWEKKKEKSKTVKAKKKEKVIKTKNEDGVRLRGKGEKLESQIKIFHFGNFRHRFGKLYTNSCSVLFLCFCIYFF